MTGYCLQTVKQLTSVSRTKSEMFTNYPHMFDYALPQDWLNQFAEWCEEHRNEVTYHLILTTCIWCSELKNIVTCCKEVLEAFETYSQSKSVS